MDVNQFGLYSSSAQMTQIHVILHSHLTSASLPPYLLSTNSALILPSIIPSPPITQNQEKHTPAGLGK